MAPTPMQQQPWWQRAAGAIGNGAAAATGAQQATAVNPQSGQMPQQGMMRGVPQKPNPWVQLAQGAGKFGGALKQKLSNAPGTGTPEGPPPINPDGTPVGGGDVNAGSGGATAGLGGNLGSTADIADFAADGRVFTKPTLVVMGDGGTAEAAVPLGYRSTAKTRPSMAQPIKPQGRGYYGE